MRSQHLKLVSLHYVVKYFLYSMTLSAAGSESLQRAVGPQNTGGAELWESSSSSRCCEEKSSKRDPVGQDHQSIMDDFL